MTTGEPCPHKPIDWVGYVDVPMMPEGPHAAASTCFRNACLGRTYAWVASRVRVDQPVRFHMYASTRRLFTGEAPS